MKESLQAHVMRVIGGFFIGFVKIEFIIMNH